MGMLTYREFYRKRINFTGILVMLLSLGAGTYFLMSDAGRDVLSKTKEAVAETNDRSSVFAPTPGARDQSPALGTEPMPTAFPATGTVRIYDPSLAKSSKVKVRVSANRFDNDDYVLEFLDPSSSQRSFLVYVTSRTVVEFTAPVGIYRLRVLHGHDWYGEVAQFGRAATVYSPPSLLDLSHYPSGVNVDLSRRS